MRHDISFQIESLGFDDTASDPADLAYNWSPDHGHDVLVDVPGGIETRTDPTSGKLQLGAFEPRVAAHDDANDPLEYLRATAWTKVGSLTGAVTRTDSALPVDTSLISTGDILWIGREAVRVTATSADSASVTRGYWGWNETPTPHAAGSAVYTGGLPYVRGRRLRLLVDGQARWTGVIRDVDVDHGGTAVRLSTDHHLAALLSEVGLGPPRDLPTQITASWGVTRRDPIDILQADNLDRWHYRQVESVESSDTQPSARDLLHPQIHRRQDWDARDRPRVLRIGEALVARSEATDDPVLSGLSPAEYTPLMGTDFGIDWNEREIARGVEDLRTHPVLWAGADATVLADTEERVVSQLQSGGEPLTHPVTIVEALLERGLQRAWRLGVDTSIGDTVIEEAPALRVDSMVVGWDAEAPDARQLITSDLLRAYGLLLGLREDGNPDVYRYGYPSITDVEGAASIDPLPDTLEIEDRLDRGVDAVDFEIGGHPWDGDDPVTYSVDLDGSPRVDQRLVERQTATVSIPGIDKRRAQAQRWDGFLAAQAKRRAQPRRLLRCKINAPDWDVAVGEVRKLAELPVEPPMTLDGNDRQDTAGAPVRILGRRYSPREDTYELYLELLGETVRVRAPSMVVRSVDGLQVSSDGGSDFYRDDTSGFHPGQELQAYDESMTPQPTVYTVASVDSPTELTLESAAPSAPVVLRLAQYPDYDPDGSGELASGERLWAYVGQDIYGV